jgi:hypothetical protein
VAGLVRRLDQRLELLKVHRPYHESDHVLNIAYNVMCGGKTLEDIELRRNDQVFLDALGVEAIPDPTTAGDFCRRFTGRDLAGLMEAINETRLEVWRQQGPEFIANRSGNKRSHSGAAAYLDQAVELCRRAGFTDILMRGDTDFSQTAHLDGWDEDGLSFVFGYLAAPSLKRRADSKAADFEELVHRAKRAFVPEEQQRSRPPRVKEEVVRRRGYKNVRLRSEDIPEFEYSPTACSKTYRMVVLRKNLSVERGETVLFDDVRYFFYITNDRRLSAAEVVFEANDRCDQENLIGQLKSGVRALHAPVNTLNANWAYLVMASLAWSPKAWMALSIPVTPRWRTRHEAERRAWLRMDFRTFRKAVIEVPVQILRSGRRRIWRLLAWRPELPVFFRLLDAL